MSLSVNQMRMQIAKVYNNNFAQRLFPNQVVAVYSSMLRSGKFDKKKMAERRRDDKQYHQMDLFEIGMVMPR